MIENWFADFKRGGTNTDGAECYSRTKAMMIPIDVLFESLVYVFCLYPSSTTG